MEAYCANCGKGIRKVGWTTWLGWGICKDCGDLPRKNYSFLDNELPNLDKKVRADIIQEINK